MSTNFIMFNRNLPEIKKFTKKFNFKTKTVILETGIRLERRNVIVVYIPEKEKQYFIGNMIETLQKQELLMTKKILESEAFHDHARIIFDNYKELSKMINDLQQMLNCESENFGFTLGN